MSSPVAITAILVLTALVVLLVALLRRTAPTDADEAPLYLDDVPDGHVFVSERFRIRARPDKLEGEPDDVTLVELKSRSRGVHASDRAQVVATALAVRADGFDVRRARLETRDGDPVTLDLDAPDDALFARIRPAVAAARLAVRGIEPAPSASPGKCRACGYRTRCPYRADTADGRG